MLRGVREYSAFLHAGQEGISNLVEAFLVAGVENGCSEPGAQTTPWRSILWRPVSSSIRRCVVIGLQKESFDILDQNNQELIRHFSSEDAPISLGIIFDTSDSMWRKIERSREAVVQFLRGSNPEDEFFLVGFNDRPDLLVDFTSSVYEIQDAFLKVKPDGTTALFDAIYLGLGRMKEARNRRGRPCPLSPTAGTITVGTL